MSRSLVPLRRAAVFAGLALLICGPARGGYKDKWPLTINLGTSTVQGSLASVRGSPDAKALLGCEVSGLAGAYGGFAVSCWAYDAAGVFAGCWSNDPVMAGALSSLNGDSLLRFSFDAQGKCTYLTATNLSWAEPKVP